MQYGTHRKGDLMDRLTDEQLESYVRMPVGLVDCGVVASIARELIERRKADNVKIRSLGVTPNDILLFYGEAEGSGLRHMFEMSGCKGAFILRDGDDIVVADDDLLAKMGLRRL